MPWPDAIELLNDEVHALSERAARLHEAGLPEAEWLLARFQMHRLACPNLSGPAGRMLIQATFAALEEHRAGLSRDAAELERVEAVAEAGRTEQARRAEAARKEAEQARARREAQAADAGRLLRAAPAQPRLAPPRPGRWRWGRCPLPVAAATGRSTARIPMQTQVDMSSDSNVFTGFSTNLSEGGVFVATVKPAAGGHAGGPDLHPPREHPHHGEGRGPLDPGESTTAFRTCSRASVCGSSSSAWMRPRRCTGSSAEREPLFYPD